MSEGLYRLRVYLNFAITGIEPPPGARSGCGDTLESIRNLWWQY